jgi:hypothetical protein
MTKTKMPKTKSQYERVQECIDIKKKLRPYLKDKDADYHKKISNCMNDYIKNGATLHEYIPIPELNKTLELGLANVFLQENLVVLRNEK